MIDSGVKSLTPGELASQEQQAAKEGYLLRDAIALDQAVNVVLGGHPDETISARSSRDAAEGYRLGRWVSRFLDLFQKNHGPKAQAGDIERAEVVIKAENESPTIPKK